MSEFYQSLSQHLSSEQQPGWIATVVETDGSTPARVGMKQFIRLNDTPLGTIGGGEIELKVIERIRLEQPREAMVWKYDLGLGEAGTEKTKMICGGVQAILVEPLQSGDTLYIFGGGHCGIALSKLAAQCGFAVTVIDDRPEWASREKHPAAFRAECLPYPELNKLAFSPNAYAVIMTHGHSHDETVLRQLVTHDWKFLGMLGSATKVAALFRRMEKDGFTAEQLQRVIAPVGFDIGSHTPQEIAVSIVAQMVAVRNNRTDLHLMNKK